MLFLSGNLCQFSDLEGSSTLSYHPCLLYSLISSTGSRDNSKVARSPQEETMKFGQVEKGQKQRCVVFYLYVRYIYILATACPLQICASL